MKTSAKIKLIIILASVLVGALAIVFIVIGVTGNTKKEYFKEYNMYLVYAAAENITPLDYETWLATIKGEKGDKGDKGDDGEDGKSAYQIWLDNGNKGSQSDFLNWLRGTKGNDGQDGRGIKNISYKDGDFIILYTDGTKETVGLPQDASEATEGLEYYLLPDDTFGVKAGTTFYLEKIVIPGSYKGKAVTQISNSAFQRATNLKEILLPDSIEKIQSYAFLGCTALEKIVIPNSVTSIENGAFNECDGLKSATIGNGVTSIGEYAFSFCRSLTSVTIPNSVTSIGNNAFYGCIGLTSITIGNGVTTIGNSAFSKCSGLTSIEVLKNNNTYSSINNCLIKHESGILVLGCKNSIIPTDGSVTTIGNSAFSGCSGLTSITIPDSVTTIGEWAFSECDGLKSIFYKGNKTQWGNINIDMPNDDLIIVTWYYYSASKPTTEGNYWHYGSDGTTPVIW